MPETSSSVIRLDEPPDLADLAHDLVARWDPWEGADRDPPDYSSRVENCGSGALILSRPTSTSYSDILTMCGSLRCPTCAAWKIDKSPRSYRRAYEAMSPALFDDVEAVFIQPFPFNVETDGPRAMDAIAERARDRGIKWTQVKAWVDEDRCHGAAFFFSDGDLSKRRGRDVWQSHRVEPTAARSFLLDDLLRPLVLARKPSASAGCVWALPSDTEPDDDEKGDAWIRHGFVDRALKDEVTYRAEAMVRAETTRAFRQGRFITPAEQDDLMRRAFGLACAEVLAEVNAG